MKEKRRFQKTAENLPVHACDLVPSANNIVMFKSMQN
jgi:hypothetical protein